jgi:hypothetical protein
VTSLYSKLRQQLDHKDSSERLSAIPIQDRHSQSTLPRP